MNKLTLVHHPIAFFKFWYQMKIVSLQICGDWFGVIVYPTGKVWIRNEAIIDILDRCPKHNIEEDTANDICN